MNSEFQSGNQSLEPLIWALLDDRAGNRSQCLGVAEALELPYVIKEVRYSPFACLPNGLFGASFAGLSHDSKLGFQPPWPDVVIAAGRRTAPVARAIKKLNGNRSRLVQIMYPGYSGINDFDLVAVPSHDKPKIGTNILTVIGAPHGITEDKLSQAALVLRDQVAELASPRIAVLIGGSTRRRAFTTGMGRDLGRMVNDMAASVQGSLMISTSRRTGASAEDAFLAEIKVSHQVFRWGQEGPNPYLGFLAMADGVVVTGDSVSMCSEVCATEAPVYIYAPPGLITDKHARMHQTLYAGGFARPLSGDWADWSHPRLNAAETIATAMRDRLGIS